MREIRPLLMRFGGFELDEANAQLKRHGHVLELPPRAFSVLCELARRPGQLVTKDALLDAVWGHRHIGESVLKSAVSQVRAAVDDDAKSPKYIETAPRRGYRFIAVAEPRPTLPSASPPDHDPAAPATHVPAPGAKPIATAMIGRGAPLARLHAAWERAGAGQRQLCWLAGDAGVGKTTLIDNFIASLGPVSFAQGQCVEQHGPGEPYLPVLEALATLCRQDPALATSLRSVAPTWLLQLPWLCSDAERENLRRELAGTSQARMLREFGELLDRCAQDKPLLLVTEDLHWSDHATVDLINHVARRRGRARWMWLASFRVAEMIAEDHPMKALRHELRMHRLCEEILLDPFSEQELAAYVAGRLGGINGSDGFIQALHRHTDGLPLFVANVVDELQAQGSLQASAQAPDVRVTSEALSVPESLAGVMERQITRLPAEQIALLEAASACGVEFSPTVVALVLERDVDWVAKQCDSLASRQQWVTPIPSERVPQADPEGRYAFRHALVRHVFHDRIGTLGRVHLHRRVASALTTASALGAAVSAAELATQFELGRDPDAALPHCAAAAAGALQQFAPADAMRLADRGLALARRCRSDPPVRELLATLHTLRGAAAAQVLGVSADETVQSFEQAQSALEEWPHHPLRSMALHGLGLGLFLRGGLAQAQDLAERNLAQALQRNDTVLVVTACDLLGQVLKLEGPPHDAIAVLEQGIEAASSLDEQTLQTAFVLDPLVNLQAALAIPLLLAGFDQRAKVQSDLALARARALKQPMARMIATWLTMLCELRREARSQVATLAAELRTITDEGALAHGEGPSQWFLGLSRAWSGSPVEGHTLIDEACRRYEQVGMLYGTPEVLGYAAEALVLADDSARARPLVDKALELAEGLQDHSYRTQLLLLKRRVALALNARRDADAAAQQALHEARRQRSPWLELTVLADLCDGPHPRAEEFDALRQAVAGMPEVSNAPLMNRARALLGGR